MALNTVRSLKPYVLPFFTLQYPTDTPLNPDSFPNSAYYNVGVRDVWLIVTCIAVMAILRDAFRLGVFEPFARWKLSRALRHKRQRITNEKSQASVNGNGHATAGNGHANGHANKNAHISPKELRQMNRSVLRFAEQGWSVVYYTLQWSYGLYVHHSLPTRIFNPVDLWVGYPHIPLAGPLKFYYLTQTAFYMHQMLILNAEARRKDHVQMMTHHVITVFLMTASYFMNFTRVGCVIMFLMDWCDIFLPLAKMLRYINLQTACDVTFGCFILTWFVTRHFLFLFVIKSTIFDVPNILQFAPWFIPETGFYLVKRTHYTFCALLLVLQVLQIIWFWMICRIAWRVLKGDGASDDRSDEEDIKED